MGRQRGTSDGHGRDRDEAIERRARAILERDDVDWVEAHARAVAEHDAEEQADLLDEDLRQASFAERRTPGRVTVSEQIGSGQASRLPPGTAEPGRVARTTSLPRPRSLIEGDSGHDLAPPEDREAAAVGAASVDPFGVHLLADAVGSTAGATFRQAITGGGSEVPFRAEMEHAFGTNFGGVRAFLGRDREMAALDAAAAAQGEQVAFASQTPDKRQVAHELTHVVQHRQAGDGEGALRQATVSDPTAAAEVEAHLVAQRVIAGEQVRVSAAPTSAIHRDPPDGGAPIAAEPVTLQAFLTEGSSLSGQPLGYQQSLLYHMNGVELRFALNQAEQGFRALMPRQYSGPESKWIRRGPPISAAPWVQIMRGQGSGWDDPEPASVTRRPGVIAYRDSPGPNIGADATDRSGPATRIYVVQNFTGWIEGIPTGGSAPQRISPVIAWFSIISLTNTSWETPGETPHYVASAQTEAGQGWRDTGPPSV